MRICQIRFNDNTKILVNNNIRTKKKDSTMIVVDLGELLEDDNKLYNCYIESSEINDPSYIREKLNELNKMPTNDKIDWFINTYNKINIIKILKNDIFDAFNSKNNLDKTYNVIIDSTADIRWNK